MSKYTISLRNIESLIGHDELVKFFTNYTLSNFLSEKEIETIEKRRYMVERRTSRKNC